MRKFSGLGGAIACLTFGAGHGLFVDRWTGHGSTSNRYVTLGPRVARERGAIGQGDGRGPMRRQAVSVLAPPPGVRVWLACGRTDMRKGLDGLAMLAQQVLHENPFEGALLRVHCSPSAAAAADWSGCCGMTGKACVCSPNVWIAAISSGR